MTEHQWVDADEALEDAAIREGYLVGTAQRGWRRDHHAEMSEAEVAELVEEAHSAGD